MQYALSIQPPGSMRCLQVLVHEKRDHSVYRKEGSSMVMLEKQIRERSALPITSGARDSVGRRVCDGGKRTAPGQAKHP